jgi:DNA adenine methylase
MKPILTYYGGKQKMTKKILSLLPKHNAYIEPFFGGGAIFWAKEPSNVECINDTNGKLINLYQIIKLRFNELKPLIDATLWSRQQYNEAKIIYNNNFLDYDAIKMAWAVFVMSNESYGGKINGGWGFCRKENKTKTLQNKIERFTDIYCERLKNTQIECNDAIKIITNFDYEDAFFYCDPPYIGADQGHYKGYTEDDFKNLLNTLSGIKGKFLLSSYSNNILDYYIKKNNWYSIRIEKFLDLSSNLKERKKKIEVLTANYEIQ